MVSSVMVYVDGFAVVTIKPMAVCIGGSRGSRPGSRLGSSWPYVVGVGVGVGVAVAVAVAVVLQFAGHKWQQTGRLGSGKYLYNRSQASFSYLLVDWTLSVSKSLRRGGGFGQWGSVGQVGRFWFDRCILILILSLQGIFSVEKSK